jgi:anti-sigma-K factor RskA
MAGKILVVVIAIFLLLAAFSSPILDGIKGWRTNDTTQTFAVTTAVGATTANVTLSYDLYQAAVPEVIAITSTQGTDTPAATTYTEATKVLLVSGLDDDLTRNLSVNYYAETDDDVMRVLGPFLGALIIGGLVAFIFMGMFKKGR